MTQPENNITTEQRAAAFANATAILALEGMVEPAEYGQFRQAVIDGRLSISAAVAVVVQQAVVPETS